MPFVLDASIAACWAFEDEEHSAAVTALQRARTEEILVPALWWFEVRNFLIVSERRKRISEAGTAMFLRDLAALAIRVDTSPVETEVLRLARTHQLTVYDAVYLELARRECSPIATLDRELTAAARAEAVPLVGDR